LVLPKPPSPLGAYVEASQVGSLLFLSGTLPLVDGKLAISGRLWARHFRSIRAVRLLGWLH
jgi:enamine deaminase RidA (YjgF/YER057c/UK114 family)